jgi:hypothetical protein
MRSLFAELTTGESFATLILSVQNATSAVALQGDSICMPWLPNPLAKRVQPDGSFY